MTRPSAIPIGDLRDENTPRNLTVTRRSRLQRMDRQRQLAGGRGVRATLPTTVARKIERSRLHRAQAGRGRQHIAQGPTTLRKQVGAERRQAAMREQQG